ncbi:MAG: coenzyme F420 hydrogenase/dehydrogenase beta subunit N-terminal domain-containing protein, partial [Rikenellaceae bacterium]
MIHITDREMCCGCEACGQICPEKCITFEQDSEGFYYPVIDKSQCIDCGLCESVCPVINRCETREPIKILAAKNLDEEIRVMSSSGGIFTLLAERILSEGGVVFGARFDKDWNVEHSHCETSEGLAQFRGSKYVQSRIGNSFTQVKAFLDSGRKVMFSGTPCQVAGLRLFLGKEYSNL